MVKVEVWL